MKSIIIFILIVVALIFLFNTFFNPKEKVDYAKEEYIDKPSSTEQKAIQNEAKQVLELIAGKEQAFFANNGYYTKSLDSLQISFPENSKYRFYINEATNVRFEACAKGNIDRDAIEDYWIIDQHGNLQNIVNDYAQ